MASAPQNVTRQAPAATGDCRCQKQAPDAAPESAHAAPRFDPVANGVEADRMLFAVIALADERQLFHVESRSVQRLNGLFGLAMRVEQVERESLVSMNVP